MNLGEFLLKAVIFHSEQRQKNKKGIFPEWLLKWFLFGNIFENDQIGSFSHLVIITLMSNRLSRVEQVLKSPLWEQKTLSSILIMYLCCTPWQLTNLGWFHALKKRLKNYVKLCETPHNTIWPSVVSFSLLSE